jgi:hypothetical protein
VQLLETQTPALNAYPELQDAITHDPYVLLEEHVFNPEPVLSEQAVNWPTVQVTDAQAFPVSVKPGSQDKAAQLDD